MRFYTNAIVVLACIVMIASCEKDTVGDGLTCDDLTDNKMIVDGKSFEIYDGGIHYCVEAEMNGGTVLTHYRTMMYGSGSTLIMAKLGIVLSNVPPVGQTTTYQLDNGMPWQWEGPPAVGKATIRVYDHEEVPEFQENWSSDGLEEGTVDVTVAADGTITYNFEVMLARGSTFEYKRFCGQNIVCL